MTEYIQITNLSLLPEDEHFQLGLKWWQQTIALSCGIPDSIMAVSEDGSYGLSLLERIEEAYILLEKLRTIEDEK